MFSMALPRLDLFRALCLANVTGLIMLPLIGILGLALAGFALGPALSGTNDDEPAPADDDVDELPIIPLDQLPMPPDAVEEDEAPPEPQTAADEVDESITGTAENDVIFAGDGDHAVDGLDGDDYIDAGAGNDSVTGDAGDDELHGEAGDDALLGGDGNDTVSGHIGNDMLTGDAGNDQMTGGDGDDRMDGGAGDDAMIGSYGDDTLTGGAGADVLFGGIGNDVVDGRDGPGETDVLDYVNGGAGDDVLLGGALDNLHGGEGADTFTLAGAGLGTTTVQDFDANSDALIVLYDGTGPMPVLSTAPGEGGVTLLVDGEPAAFVIGQDSIDLAAVRLVAA